MTESQRMDTHTTDQFETYRSLMLSIAYRMLGSITDAEDIVQDAYIRYHAQPPEQIVSHKAFLSTVVTRLCLNQLQAARTQRETYIGPWLPEPVFTDADSALAPVAQVELHESISLAFLVLLEQLTPMERAVFLLREVFDYEYREIAAILGNEEAACRQLLRRAKQHLAARRPRFKSSPAAHRQMLNQFLQAVGAGEMDGLMQILADDVALWADGGGKVRGAILKPLHGSEQVARFLLDVSRRSIGVFTAEIADVNGEPALVLRGDGTVRLIIALDIDGDRVRTVRVIGNPDKLQWVNNV